MNSSLSLHAVLNLLASPCLPLASTPDTFLGSHFAWSSFTIPSSASQES